jgi:hypothetical protein
MHLSFGHDAVLVRHGPAISPGQRLQEVLGHAVMLGVLSMSWPPSPVLARSPPLLANSACS